MRAATNSPGGSVRTAPVACFWLGAGIAALLLHSVAGVWVGNHFTMAALAILSLLFGLWVFLTDGGPRLTPVGCYSLAFAVFVGFAGIYRLWVVSDDASIRLLIPALSWAYNLHVLMWALFWADRGQARRLPSSRDLPPRRREFTGDGGPGSWIRSEGVGAPGRRISTLPLVVGGVALVSLACVIVPMLHGPGRAWSTYSAEAGLFMLATGLFYQEGERWGARGLLLGAAFAAYAMQTYSGVARLMLGTAGVGLLLVIAGRSSGYLLKFAVVLGSAPALFLFGLTRLQRYSHGLSVNFWQISGSSLDAQGLGSLVGPLDVFARLLALEDAGALPRARGATFWATMVGIVPRRYWTEKPVGLGRQLVPVVHPDLVQTGHSDATLLYGEWLFNFGLVGFLGMFVVVGVGIRYLDGVLSRMHSNPLADTRSLLTFLSVIVLAASLPDLMWNGSFVYSARVVTRLLMLLPAALLLTGLFGRRYLHLAEPPHRASPVRPWAAPGKPA